jgi:hypothetical protein
MRSLPLEYTQKFNLPKYGQNSFENGQKLTVVRSETNYLMSSKSGALKISKNFFSLNLKLEF